MSPPSYICVLFSLDYTLKYSKPLESHILNLKRLPQLLEKELYLYLVFMFFTTIPNHLLQPGCQLYCPTELFQLCVLVTTTLLKPLGNFHPHFTPLLSSNWTSLPPFKGFCFILLWHQALRVFFLTCWQLLLSLVTPYMCLFIHSFIWQNGVWRHKSEQYQMWFLRSQGPIHPLQLYSVQVVPQYHHGAECSFHLGLQLCRALSISKLLHASYPLLRKIFPSQPIPKNGSLVNSSEKFALVFLSQSAYPLISLYTTFFFPM